MPQLIQELRHEINQMREERQMLGQMVSQVHQQQEELKALHQQLHTQLETSNKSLEALTTAQQQQTEQLSKNARNH